MNLEGKTAIVTGSSNGIGKEVAIQLARKGCKVVVTYKDDGESGKRVQEECNKTSEAILVKLDVQSSKSIGEMVLAASKKFGKIDLLVNNAGTAVFKELDKQTEAEIENQINTNLVGLIKVTKATLSGFNKYGVIINIGSSAGKQGFSGLAPYCATKYGVRGFTQALSFELTSINVYSVNPGMTSTRMTNYKGVPAEKVGEVVVKACQESLGKKSGDDVDCWKYI
jgi:3-oxoacyl-[acyl-carrier protein] reductase